MAGLRRRAVEREVRGKEGAEGRAGHAGRLIFSITKERCLLGVSVKIFPERFTRGGKRLPEDAGLTGAGTQSE